VRRPFLQTIHIDRDHSDPQASGVDLLHHDHCVITKIGLHRCPRCAPRFLFRPVFRNARASETAASKLNPAKARSLGASRSHQRERKRAHREDPADCGVHFHASSVTAPSGFQVTRPPPQTTHFRYLRLEADSFPVFPLHLPSNCNEPPEALGKIPLAASRASPSMLLNKRRTPFGAESDHTKESLFIVRNLHCGKRPKQHACPLCRPGPPDAEVSAV